MMTALILAAALAAPPQYDTVTTSDGTRLIGTVVEESPTKGITIQLADGTTRRLERSEVRRVEFSDGSITVWEAPAPAAAPAPAPAPAPAQVAPAPPAQLDTVYFAGGGRVRGRVLEEHPKDGVTVQLSDGTTRHYAPEEVVRIQYGDGSTSRRRSSPRYDEDRPARLAPPPPRPVPQPVYTMPPREPVQRAGIPQLVPLYGSLGIGGTWFGGDAERSIAMDELFHGQFHLQLEGGLRLNPNVAIGVYLDGGAGDVRGDVRTACRAAGYDDCLGTSARFGFMVKHTWNPTSPAATWLGIGTGWEVGSISGTYDSMDGDHSDGDELLTYTGRELIRLTGGVDYRTNQVLGFGFYGAVSWGTYDRVEDRAWELTSGFDEVADTRMHTTFQLGVRMILFP